MSAENERALRSGGNQPEGVNQKPAKDSVWSKATRRARARAARRGTIAADRRIVIEDTPDRGATTHELTEGGETTRRARRLTDNVAALPLVIRRTVRGKRALVWRTPNGTWWRKGGIIQIKRSDSTPDSGHAFVVTLYKGANVEDVRFLLGIVADARRAINLDLWDKINTDWADDLTFGFTASRRYVDPYIHSDYSMRALVCDEPLCRHQWHDAPLHEFDSIDGAGYSLSVTRCDDEPAWHVDVSTDDAEFTPTGLTGFINDLQWMRAECERVNARRGI